MNRPWTKGIVIRVFRRAKRAGFEAVPPYLGGPQRKGLANRWAVRAVPL